jgi:PEP-CTERM motif
MRKVLLGLTLVPCLAASVAVHADTITYSFDLIQQSGNGIFAPDNKQIIGSGTFTLVSTTATPGAPETYRAIDQNNQFPTNYVQSMDFLIDGLDIDLADAGSNQAMPLTQQTNATNVEFNGSGSLSQIHFTSNVSGLTFNGNSGLNYTFSDSADGNGSNGKIGDFKIISTQIAATPEPSSLFLFGTGLLTLALFSRKAFA